MGIKGIAGEPEPLSQRGSLRGAKPLLRKNPPLPLAKGKGTQGMGLNKDRGGGRVGRKSTGGGEGD